MKLYRYLSGETVRMKRGLPKHRVTAYFMPEDDKGDYPDPLMATVIIKGDSASFGENDTIEEISHSNLDPKGADDFVTAMLGSLRWVPSRKAPFGLHLRVPALRDKSPGTAQWFYAEVPDDYVPKFETEITAALHLHRMATEKPGAHPVIKFTLLAILAVIAWYYFFGPIG